MKIGLISDTHGLLRPEALAALQGCEQLIHAGDIGKPEILAALRELAPLTVVRGNNDQDDWADEIPHSARLHLGGIAIYVVHELADVPQPLPEGIGVVVSGHSHRPLQQWRDGVFYINPGSAGPRRFKLPISVGLLHVEAGAVRSELIELG